MPQRKNAGVIRSLFQSKTLDNGPRFGTHFNNKARILGLGAMLRPDGLIHPVRYTVRSTKYMLRRTRPRATTSHNHPLQRTPQRKQKLVPSNSHNRQYASNNPVHQHHPPALSRRGSRIRHMLQSKHNRRKRAEKNACYIAQLFSRRVQMGGGPVLRRGAGRRSRTGEAAAQTAGAAVGPARDGECGERRLHVRED